LAYESGGHIHTPTGGLGTRNFVEICFEKISTAMQALFSDKVWNA